MTRWPLELPPVQKRRRRHESWWRAFWGFVVTVLLVLLYIYGVGPALEYWQEQAMSEAAQETR